MADGPFVCRSCGALDLIKAHIIPASWRGGFIGFDLSPHTTDAEARELLAMMDRHIRHLTFTGPVRPEFIDAPGRAAIAKRSRR
jgi:hypothetical protein